MDSLCEIDYARAGCIAPLTFVVTADECPLKNRETDQIIPATAEPQLRAAGLPSTLRGGHIMLTKDSHQICEKDEKLNSDQCKLLKLIGLRVSHFRIHLVGKYCEGHYSNVSE
jgi:mRNA turnover protein 4